MIDYEQRFRNLTSEGVTAMQAVLAVLEEAESNGDTVVVNVKGTRADFVSFTRGMTKERIERVRMGWQFTD